MYIIQCIIRMLIMYTVQLINKEFHYIYTSQRLSMFIIHTVLTIKVY